MRIENNIRQLVTEISAQMLAELNDESAAMKAVIKQQLMNSQAKLASWLHEFADGQLSQLELEHLIKGQLELNLMQAITQTGLTQIKAQQLRDKIIQSLIAKLLTTIPTLLFT